MARKQQTYTAAAVRRALDHHKVGGAVRSYMVRDDGVWVIDLPMATVELSETQLYGLCHGLAAAELAYRNLITDVPAARVGPVARKGARVKVTTTNGGEIEGLLVSTYRRGQGVRIDTRDWTPDRESVPGFIAVMHRHTTNDREHAHPDGASPHRHHDLGTEQVLEIESERIKEVVAIDA